VPELWSAALEHPRPSRRATGGVCPFCDGRATVTDWRPGVDWLVVENCACSGFFLWAELTKARLTKLARNRRKQLALQIRGLRASGHAAWCATEDGTKTGLLIVRAERSERSKYPDQHGTEIG
jgi:hypothetical protein